MSTDNLCTPRRPARTHTPAPQVFSRVELKSGVERVISTLEHPVHGWLLSITFWRDGALNGRYMIMRRDVHVLLRACAAARAGEDIEAGRIQAGCPVMIIGARRFCAVVARTLDGAPLGRPTVLGGAELEALERAAKWLVDNTDAA